MKSFRLEFSKTMAAGCCCSYQWSFIFIISLTMQHWPLFLLLLFLTLKNNNKVPFISIIESHTYLKTKEFRNIMSADVVLIWISFSQSINFEMILWSSYVPPNFHYERIYFWTTRENDNINLKKSLCGKKQRYRLGPL